MSPSTRVHGFPHILCPVDFSRHSRAALRCARALAEQSGGKLTVMTVNDPMLAAALAAATHDPWELDARTATELRRFVSTTLGAAGMNATLKIVVGHPPDQIDRIARLLSVDLVVMGTHGLSGPRKWFVGSTTESLLRRSRVPVLAVPARGRWYLRQAGTVVGERALVPIDLDGTDRAEIRRVSDAVQRLGAKALFLHVVKPAQLPPWLAGKAVPVDRQRLRSAFQEMQRLVGGSRAIRIRVVIGNPVEEIEKAAVKEKAAVIVMPLKRHGLLGPRRGSIAYRVVCAGVAAVLAVPGLGGK